MLAATATPKHHHITEDDEEMTNGDHSGDVSRDLDIDENIKDPVEDRRTLAERSERLHDQLKVSLSCIYFVSILRTKDMNSNANNYFMEFTGT